MGEVVSLKRTDEHCAPHLSGKATCLACKHEWVGVAPLGTCLLECPQCHCDKGVFKYTVERREEHWVCNCGNHFFLVSRDGCYCPNCGQWAHFCRDQ